MNASPAEFYFELSANGEQTSFQEVEGVSTEVALRRNINPGENPFKFRLPSLPKTNNVRLKKGRSTAGSKLMQWCAQCNNPDAKPDRNRAMLTLKDAKGKSLLEWTLYNAFPKQSHAVKPNAKSAVTEIEDLELGYSFFTLAKK